MPQIWSDELVLTGRTTPEQIQAAARTCAANATDKDELEMFLRMIGIIDE